MVMFLCLQAILRKLYTPCSIQLGIQLGCKPFLPYASGISQSISLKLTMNHSDSELSASEDSELSASEASE